MVVPVFPTIPKIGARGRAFNGGTVAVAPTVVVRDLFTGTAGTVLSSHTADSGHTWASHPSYASGATKVIISGVNTIRMVGSSPATAAFYLSNSPAVASGNYDVAFDYVVQTNVGSSGVLVGYSAAADTGYVCRVSGTSWSIIRFDAGASTVLDSDPSLLTPASATTYNMLVEVRTTGVTWKRGGSTIATTNDTTYTGVLRQGVRYGNVAMTDSTGIHIDNLVVTDA